MGDDVRRVYGRMIGSSAMASERASERVCTTRNYSRLQCTLQPPTSLWSVYMFCKLDDKARKNSTDVCLTRPGFFCFNWLSWSIMLMLREGSSFSNHDTYTVRLAMEDYFRVLTCILITLMRYSLAFRTDFVHVDLNPNLTKPFKEKV